MDMRLNLKDLGWYLAWDKEGRYPIDTSKPVYKSSYDKSFSVYFTNKPIQQSDGTWVKYQVFAPANTTYYRSYWCCVSNTYYFTYYPSQTYLVFVEAGNLTNRENVFEISGIYLETFKMLNNDYVFCDYKANSNDNKLLINSLDTSFYFKVLPEYKKIDDVTTLDLTRNSTELRTTFYRDLDIELSGYLGDDVDKTIISGDVFSLKYDSNLKELVFEYYPIIGEPIVLKNMFRFLDEKMNINIKTSVNGIYFKVNDREIKIDRYIYMLPDKRIINPGIKIDIERSANWSSYYDAKIPTELQNLPHFRSDVINEKYWTEYIGDKLFDGKKEVKTSAPGIYMHPINPTKITFSNVTEPFYIGLSLNVTGLLALRKVIYYYDSTTNEIQSKSEWSVI